MSSIILKYLKPICSKLFSVHDTLPVNKLGVRYFRETASKFKKNSLRKLKTQPSRKRTEQSAEEIEDFKSPSLIYIQSLLKTQPNFKLRSLWRIQPKASEWPLFNQTIQYKKPINLKNLVNTRLTVDPIFLNDKELNEIQNQKYLPQRVKNLGPDLAAIHFFTDRRAAIRLAGQNYWIVGGAPVFTSTEQLNYCIRGGSLDEDRYMSRCYVKALDCSNFSNTGIRYEGLKYLTGLRHLNWLSLKNQRHINAWCLDRIAGLSGNILEYLDISKCDLDLGCILALSRMHALRMLVIKDPGAKNDIKKGLSYLKELNPNLTVKSMGVEQILCVSGVAGQKMVKKVK